LTSCVYKQISPVKRLSSGAEQVVDDRHDVDRPARGAHETRPRARRWNLRGKLSRDLAQSGSLHLAAV
jgi:hypothetical protein